MFFWLLIIAKASGTSQPKPKCAARYGVANEPQSILHSKSQVSNASFGGNNALILNELQNPPRLLADIFPPIITAHTHFQFTNLPQNNQNSKYFAVKIQIIEKVGVK